MNLAHVEAARSTSLQQTITEQQMSTRPRAPSLRHSREEDGLLPTIQKSQQALALQWGLKLPSRALAICLVDLEKLGAILLAVTRKVKTQDETHVQI